METSIKPHWKHARRWRTVLLALLAVGFLLAMVLTGKVTETRQLVKFEARGVLAVPPEQVRRVDLHVGEHTTTFVRFSDHAWMGGTAVRVMHHDAYRGTPLHEFGLERPRCSVVLSDARRVLLEASFGAYNPQDLLQYMQLRDDTNLYLMSRFVGQAWEHLGEHMGVRPVSP